MATPKTISKDSPVIIIGAETWGCSTALHLARRGYTHVKVLDAHPVPSPISAGNDINKIVEQATSDSNEEGHSISSNLLRIATHGWLHDPVFTPYYHDTGYIICAHTPEGLAQLIGREILNQEADFEWFDTPDQFRARMPEGVLTGAFPGWKGGFKRRGAGWVYARGALMSAYREAERLGVTFITGTSGTVTALFEQDGEIRGVRTASGQIHLAPLTILANGAQAPDLLDFKNQLRPTAWTLAHIKMTPEECEVYRDLPALFNIESGFFMEPDTEKGELKICDENPGYTNLTPDPASSGGRSSVPFARRQIPKEAEQRVRGFLRDTMPQLAERPLAFARICWCADTPDRKFLIDWYPEKKGLVLAVGGSGHGFMHITNIGGFVCDLIEGVLDERLRGAMRWREEEAVGRDWSDVQERRGGPNRVMDFGDVREWTDIKETN